MLWLISPQLVEPEQRGLFSSLEVSAQNIFELLSFASTIVFSRPEQFKYPAVCSLGAITVAGILYAVFVRQERGHLFHASECMKGKRFTKRQSRYRSSHGWEEIPQHELPQVEVANE